MVRQLFSCIGLFALGFCLFSTALQTCGTMSCGSASGSESCGFTKNEIPKSCSPFDDCGKESGSQSPRGCCICIPNCCVFIVPEVKYDLCLTVPGEFSTRLFGEQFFALQSVDFSIWRPPVFEVYG